jgi:hypothetical protein
MVAWVVNRYYKFSGFIINILLIVKHHENMDMDMDINKNNDTDNFTASTTVPIGDIIPTQYMNLRIPSITDINSFFSRIKYYYETYPVKMSIITVCRAIISLIAATLAWNCNEFNGSMMRIFVTFVAFVFAEIYIVYYAIYHSIIGVACYTGFSDLDYDNGSNSYSSDSSY